jgi:hypothetical protein
LASALLLAGCVAVAVPASGQTGPVAAYGFNEGAGASVADASGNNNTGAASGTAWSAAGRFGGALSFNGGSSLVTVGHSASLSLTAGMTLEAWVMTPTPSNWRTVMLKERTGGLSYALYAGDLAGRPSGYIRRTADIDATSPTVLPANTWVHLATTYDGAWLRLYVNGTPAASTVITGSIVTSTLPLRIGGNTIWGEYFTGLIDEVRIYNRALTTTEIQTDMVTPVGGTPPPTFTLSGAVTPSASGSGSQIAVTGTASASTVADANGNFSIGGLADGTYTVTVTKANFLIHPASLPVTIAGANVSGLEFIATSTAGIPSVVGAWDPPVETGMVAVHMGLMHTGKVLMFSGTFAGSYVEQVWDPATGAMTPVPNPYYNLFCAGHTQLADGRILVAGGHEPSTLGAANANIFDPVTLKWSALPNMAYRRWYPTTTTLPDGRVLVTSGGQTCLTCIADVPEIFDPVTMRFTTFPSARLNINYYPFMFVLPDGKVLSAGSTEEAYQTRTLDMNTGGWTMVDAAIRDGHSAVMYRPGKILKTGTAADSGSIGTTAPTAYVLDMTQPSPAWRQVASMAFPRAYQNSTMLPDGNVLITGGGTTRDGYDVTKGVLTAELWSPQTETFQTLSDGKYARLYHSTALLLPDARVLIAGSGFDGPGINQTKTEIFSPPYLFKGPRPDIVSAPDLLQYDSPFAMLTTDANSIASVVLIRPGSVTHAFDMDQRYVELRFSPGEGSLLTVWPPANANLAPPGYYMLFLVNKAGVPSIAKFVHFPAPAGDTQAPSAPGNLVGLGGLGTTALTWSASTDNIGVTLYNVHRSTGPGFVPSAANRVGQTATTAFNQSGLAAGTYYYLVTAQDATGNISAPSAEALVAVAADTTAPLLALTSPTGGASVSGSITLSATASDDVGVAGVQFQVDGVNIGAEKTSAPYSISWNSIAVANGPHTIKAIARDAAGNRSESAAAIEVANVAPPAPPGLVAAYNFDEGTGTQVQDVSGGGNVGVASYTTWSTAGRSGSALSFNGTSSWVTIADAPSLRLTSGMTMEAWVRPSSGSGWRTVILKERAGQLTYALYSANGASRPASWVWTGTDYSVSGTAAVSTTTWTHLAVTYDGSALRFYTNGVLVKTTAGVPNLLSSTGVLRIGGNSVWGEYFKGLIDDVRIYSRALSVYEIQTDMNTPVK